MDPILGNMLVGMGFTAVQTQIMANQGLQNAASFLLIDDKGIDDILELLIGVPVITKSTFRALQRWLFTQNRDNLDIDLGNFNQDMAQE